MTELNNGLAVGDFLEALYKVHSENPIHFADPDNQSNHINYITGKMMVETKGKASPEFTMKVVKMLIESNNTKHSECPTESKS